ncbi:toluene-4-monooxygenase system B family protein [Natronolimnohabitans sp. A-GB9]|uniref:toluene-4-monooxygenase system B family protein n=1 Tax=Natronolimnohabitans sp. A-GB9 TaxID=3069757 RepID=UPI0027B70A7A|nr:toluene-4-monooxygenase system B family protein [Natronolimnohabitans sp. A-GB9]MDQ2052516.1 toluene-4-monooxygenase system B family protein [Natronolimnohabitans sp. A-GB9]
MADHPLLVRFRTDDYPTLVPVGSKDTVSEAAEKITHVVDSRVHIDHDRPVEVVFKGEIINGDQLIKEVFEPMDYIEIQYEGSEIPDGYGEFHPAWAERSMLEKYPEHAKPTQ